MIYAIDFGTSNSLLGAVDSDGTIIPPIPLDPIASDPTILRSVLYFPNMKQAFYGQEAIEEFVRRDMEGRLIRSIKKHLPIRSLVGTYIDDRPVNLEDLIGFFLLEMRKRANKYFGKDIDRVVLGRPARFSEDDADDAFAQYRLERAAKNAGFQSIEFFPEPLAAAFEFRTRLTETQRVLVADFGGGTSDFTVIEIGPKPYKASDVLAIGGVAVAGDAFDSALMRGKIAPHFGADVSYQVPFGSNVLTMPKALMEKICSPADMSLLRSRDTMEFFRNVRQWSLGSEDQTKIDRLFCLIQDQQGFAVFEEIDQTKRRLSTSKSTRFVFGYPGIEIGEEVERSEFEELSRDRIDRILKSLDDTIRAASLKPKDIDLVCATGGTAKVPALQQALTERFGSSKIQEHNHFHSVARGLCERARQLL